jgi:20S proteasome alpha/beta subunit
MTIIIGFTYADGINMASDSQMTCEDHKRLDTEKISEVVFKSGHSAMVAIAGDVTFAAHFKEVFQEKAKSVIISDPKGMARVANEAAKEARDSLLTAYYHPSLGAGAGYHYLENRETLFLLAYYFDSQPYIYSLRLAEAIAIKRDEPFVALGSGAGMADFILTGFNLRDLAIKEALGMAAYTVEMCVRHDPYCGGPLQLGTLSEHNKPSPVIYWSQMMLDGYVRSVAMADADIIRDLPQKISENLDRYQKQLGALSNAGLMGGPLAPGPIPKPKPESSGLG